MKRYILTTDRYFYAPNDEEAIKTANSMAREEDLREDNQCSVVSIQQSYFGATAGQIRKIDLPK